MIRHTYATTDELREYLSGTTYSSTWTSDSAALRAILEAQSRRIDLFCGGGAFGPKTDTRYFDIGAGSLRHSPQYAVNAVSGGNIGVADQLASVVPLDGWLVSATTVTAYDATDRGASDTLSEGYNADYWLMPYNESPKTILEMNEDTTKELDAGQQTLAIAGTWGYMNETSSVTTSDAISSTTATTVSVGSASDLSPAQTIIIDSEQLYVTAISGNTLTVERGVNGTSSATHSGGATVYRYLYPELVVQACKDMAKIVFRDRDMGVTQTIGPADASVTRSDRDLRDVLNILMPYRVASTSNGLIF
jgi:hypothetical protein